MAAAVWGPDGWSRSGLTAAVSVHVLLAAAFVWGAKPVVPPRPIELQATLIQSAVPAPQAAPVAPVAPPAPAEPEPQIKPEPQVKPEPKKLVEPVPPKRPLPKPETPPQVRRQLRPPEPVAQRPAEPETLSSAAHAATAAEAPVPAALDPAPAPVPEAASAPAPAPAPAPAATASAADAPVIAPVFSADYLNNPAPVYPPISRRLGEQGKVMLRVHVERDGQPVEVVLRASSGSARLDQAAMDAVRRWKFVPARRGSEPVAAWVVVPINFSLGAES